MMQIFTVFTSVSLTRGLSRLQRTTMSHIFAFTNQILSHLSIPPLNTEVLYMSLSFNIWLFIICLSPTLSFQNVHSIRSAVSCTPPRPSPSQLVHSEASPRECWECGLACREWKESGNRTASLTLTQPSVLRIL